MAVIYETKEDADRAQLSADAQRQRNSQKSFLNIGIFNFVLGAANVSLSNALKEIKELKTQQGVQQDWSSRNINRIFGIGGLLAGIVGLAGIALSFVERSKAKKMEAKLEKLGPQTAVYPVGVLPPGLEVNHGHELLKNSAFQETVTFANGKDLSREIKQYQKIDPTKIEPTSLIGQATRPESERLKG